MSLVESFSESLRNTNKTEALERVRRIGRGNDVQELVNLKQNIMPLYWSIFHSIKDFGIELTDFDLTTNGFIVEFCNEIELNWIASFDSYFIGFMKNKYNSLREKYYTKSSLLFKHALSLDNENSEAGASFLDNVSSKNDEKQELIYKEFYAKYLYSQTSILNDGEKKVIDLHFCGWSFIEISEIYDLSYSRVLTIFKIGIEKIELDCGKI